MATAPTLVPVDEVPKVTRARSGRVSMYPGIVRNLALAPGQKFRLGPFTTNTAQARRSGVTNVPTTGGKVIAETRKGDDGQYVYVRFERKGRTAITVAGEPVEVEAPAES